MKARSGMRVSGWFFFQPRIASHMLTAARYVLTTTSTRPT